jgi:hypothetical protein
MEEAMGLEQIKIGQRVADSNLKIETLGKVAIWLDGKARYPVSVSYDMGWQKKAKTYDSLSGQGLMIGDRTKRVVCFKNYSKACGFCQKHAKKIQTDKTPDVPVKRHNCPKNHDGSSKGMEAKGALDCLLSVWTHSEICAFIDIVCIDDDATTKAYLTHRFEDLDALGLPRPTNTKGEPKTAKADNKGQLPRNHPIIIFLADLCHRVRTFGKYLWKLKGQGKKKSQMNRVDCLRLKRNYAWWLFAGRRLTFDEFKRSCKSPVLHHFNDHSTCGSWCKHTDKSEIELKKLTKYRCKVKNPQLYLFCTEIIDRFSTEKHLKECHHRMHSQKNEAMNKSVMRYAPKEKTFCRSMALTSRISTSIGIDTLGHAKFFEDLFFEMKFHTTELTFSGLRRMWRKKEYGRIYSGLRHVKRRRRIKQRDSMIEGSKKLEEDAKAGMAYSSGIRMRDGDDEEGEEPKKKRARKQGNNKLTRKCSDECKCGGRDHQRTSSSKCPWKGLSKIQVAENYVKRLEGKAGEEKSEKSENCTTSDPTANPVEDEIILVQSTSKFWVARVKKWVARVKEDCATSKHMQLTRYTFYRQIQGTESLHLQTFAFCR